MAQILTSASSIWGGLATNSIHLHSIQYHTHRNFLLPFFYFTRQHLYFSRMHLASTSSWHTPQTQIDWDAKLFLPYRKTTVVRYDDELGNTVDLWSQQLPYAERCSITLDRKVKQFLISTRNIASERDD